MILFGSIFLSIFCFSFTAGQTLSPLQYEADIIFYGFNGNKTFISTFNTTIEEQGCDPNGNFAIIVHGWMEGYKLGTLWVNATIQNLVKYRGGCVFFMDYSKYSNNANYFALTPHLQGISNVLLKKFKQIKNYDRQYCFGFSFGAWLCSETGKKLGNQTIDRMDLCDMAKYTLDLNIDPKPAAKNVACIHTSNDKGTDVYNCHQNFRMGYCGHWQLAAGPYPLGSHGLCPHMYNTAFTTAFVPCNTYKCSSPRLAKNLTDTVRMGYLGNFNRTLVRGDVFIATARYPPYLVVNNTLENKKPV